MKILKEIYLSIFIIALVIFIVLPVPKALLDFLLMTNIALACIILLNTIYSKEALELSMFPTILLLMTMFRLVLNIASTALIIGEGDAGEVVATFGNFVARGNIIVGTIIFVIIIIVNFMVITKGAERVAEVTARFTLDAMPGKQMAIDADLNTGIINEQEARARRKKIQDESNFYGSMDGASKFVKGDAVAGILITFINIIGGLVMGVTGFGNGEVLSFQDALNKYTLLTIGDGLVGQVPSLLISLSMGILVTKANVEDNLSDTLRSQLLSSPIVLYITGSALIFLGLFGKMPKIIFIPAGCGLIFLAYRLGKQQKIKSIEGEVTSEDLEIEEIRKPENVIGLLQLDAIELEFGYGIIPLADVNQGGDLLDRVVMIRRQIALELGVVVPIIRLRDNIQLSPNQYIIKIKGTEVAGGEILFDHYMAMNPGYVEEEIDGIETVEPSFGLPALWISEAQRERAEALGYTVVDPPSIIATQLTEVVKKHLHELLTRQDVQTLVDNVKETNPALVEELIPKTMNLGEIQKVLANLLKEGISTRDLVTILETLADYAPSTRDTEMLTEYVRQSLRRAISKKFFSNDVNTVITLDPELEQQIMDAVQHTEQGSYLAMDPQTTQKIIDRLTSEVNKLTARGQQPIILTSPIVRIYFKKLVEQVAPDLVVLSYNELDPAAEVQSVGMVSLA